MTKLLETNDTLNLSFYCPGCKCYHGISTKPPGPVWEWNGSMDKPTFHPSLRVKQGSNLCHSFITNGYIRFLNDCTHELVGQTVEIPEE